MRSKEEINEKLEKLEDTIKGIKESDETLSNEMKVLLSGSKPTRVSVIRRKVQIVFTQRVFELIVHANHPRPIKRPGSTDSGAGDQAAPLSDSHRLIVLEGVGEGQNGMFVREVSFPGQRGRDCGVVM